MLVWVEGANTFSTVHHSSINQPWASLSSCVVLFLRAGYAVLERSTSSRLKRRCQYGVSQRKHLLAPPSSCDLGSMDAACELTESGRKTPHKKKKSSLFFFSCTVKIWSISVCGFGTLNSHVGIFKLSEITLSSLKLHPLPHVLHRRCIDVTSLLSITGSVT